MAIPGKKRIIVSEVLAAVVMAAVYLLLWGKLFVFSPVSLGFDRHELTNTVIYTQHGAAFDDFRMIDDLIPGVEAFHELAFIQKPRIFIFRDRASYERRSLSKARFCAFPNGSLVIAPWSIEEAAAGEISLAVYLTHELSHILLVQYMGVLRSFSYPPWLLEGIATYSADQMGTSWYPDRDETYALMRAGNFMPPEDYKTGREDDVELDVPYRMTFIYSEFACYVDYLIRTGGEDTFIAYMKALLHDTGHDTVFREHYGVGFDESLRAFRQQVQQEDTGA